MTISKDRIVAAAEKYIRREQYDKAIREYERLAASDPEDVKSRLTIGYLHARKGDRGEATRIYLEVAGHYENAGSPQKTAAVLKQVLYLRPRYLDVHLKLADLYKGMDQPAESRTHLEGAYKLATEEQRTREGLRILEAMVELDPGNVALCIRLGEAYAQVNRVDEAVDALTRATDLLRMAEWVDDFMRVAERLLFLRPDNPELSRELASLYLRRGDPKSALQKLQRCYEADETDTETLSLLADTFLAFGQQDKAITILKVLATFHEERAEIEYRDEVHRRILYIDPALRDEILPRDHTPLDSIAGEMVTRTPPVPLTAAVTQILEIELVQDGDEGGEIIEGELIDDGSAPGIGGEPYQGTQELNLSDLEIVLDPSHPDGEKPRFIPAVTAPEATGETLAHATEEWDLAELEAQLELNDTHVGSRSFIPAVTVPEALADEKEHDPLGTDALAAEDLVEQADVLAEEEEYDGEVVIDDAPGGDQIILWTNTEVREQPDLSTDVVARPDVRTEVEIQPDSQTRVERPPRIGDTDPDAEQTDVQPSPDAHESPGRSRRRKR